MFQAGKYMWPWALLILRNSKALAISNRKPLCRLPEGILPSVHAFSTESLCLCIGVEQKLAITGSDDNVGMSECFLCITVR